MSAAGAPGGLARKFIEQRGHVYGRQVDRVIRMIIRVIGARDHNQITRIDGGTFVVSHVGQRCEEASSTTHSEANGARPVEALEQRDLLRRKAGPSHV